MRTGKYCLRTFNHGYLQCLIRKQTLNYKRAWDMHEKKDKTTLRERRSHAAVPVLPEEAGQLTHNIVCLREVQQQTRCFKVLMKTFRNWSHQGAKNCELSRDVWCWFSFRVQSVLSLVLKTLESCWVYHLNIKALYLLFIWSCTIILAN